MSGNTPIFPLSSPFHQPLSSTSRDKTVTISPSTNVSSSLLTASYGKSATQTSLTISNLKIIPSFNVVIQTNLIIIIASKNC